VPSLLRGGPVSSHTEESPACLREGASGPFTFLPASSSLSSTFRWPSSYAASSRVHLRSPVRSSP